MNKSNATPFIAHRFVLLGHALARAWVSRCTRAHFLIRLSTGPSRFSEGVPQMRTRHFRCSRAAAC